MLALRCVYVHVPKAAGVSVARSLFGSHGAGHLTIRDLRRLFVDVLKVQDFDRYFKFTVVRNPWSRTYSAYAFLKQGGVNAVDRVRASKSVDLYRDFNDFVRGWLTSDHVNDDLHLHFRPQKAFLTDLADDIAVDYIGRIETLQHDYAVIARRLGVQSPLRHENRSVHDDYRRYYDDETAGIVGRVYRDDVEAFSYRFEPVDA